MKEKVIEFMNSKKLILIVFVLAAILFPILTIFIHNNYLVQGAEGMDFGYIIYGIIIGLFVCFNHRENIKRILKGTENKLSFKKKTE